MSGPVTGDADRKSAVRDFWNMESCGERYAVGADEAAALNEQSEIRYELEPYLRSFARFHDGRGQDVLEVGVGMGADHLEWAKEKPRSLTGVDLTPRAIEFTRARFAAAGLTANVELADAERLPFPDESFDLVYSWGVLHHSPDTQRAVDEVRRVLRPGGKARIMIYHSRSIVGAVLWVRYGLFAGAPFRSLSSIYASHLESPGTKAYSLSDAQRLFGRFSSAKMEVCQAPSDLLLPGMGRRHEGPLLTLAQFVWPRRLIRTFGRGVGLYLMIDAVK
ncbi:MAG: class I SAM-dependent methyltransferase [Gemmatimonadota bacterium]